MRILIALILFIAGVAAAVVAMTALVGAGMLRNGPVWLVAVAAVAPATICRGPMGPPAQATKAGPDMSTVN